jgi:two-component system sensor histidine kinase DegS
MRLRIFDDGFGRRLSASLGVAEAFRVENYLCAARIVLALYCYAGVYLIDFELNFQPWRIQGLLKIYVLYSFIIFATLRLQGAADSIFQLTALAGDLLFAGIVTLLTGGPDSPFVVLLGFVVITTAYRSGLRDTRLTTSVCASLLFMEVIVAEKWPGYFDDGATADFRIERLLLRSVFVMVISLLLGYMVVRGKRLRAESALMLRVVEHADSEGEMELALEKLFAEIAPLYTPLKALIALRKGNTEQVFSWEISRTGSVPQACSIRTVLRFSKLEVAAFSFPAHTWYLQRRPGRSPRTPRLLALDASGMRVGSLDVGDLNAYFPALNVPSLMVSAFSFGDAWSGRVILIGPQIYSDSHEALRFLYRFVNHVGTFLRDVDLLRDIRRQAEDRVRSRFTRELHDGTLQSLLSMEMQIEVLNRQCSNLSADVERRLTALQTLVRQEALNLRDLIENTKPLNFSSKELPDFLAEVVARFRRDTNISVRLEIVGGDITLTPGICHEIVRIVQEGLSNVRKHSRAQNVVITFCEGREGQYKLSIGDDGEGFGFRGRVTNRQLDESHRGPGVIKERVRLIGGELTIDSKPGHGARLEITIPDESDG